jgi:hypothetical protein
VWGGGAKPTVQLAHRSCWKISSICQKGIRSQAMVLTLYKYLNVKWKMFDVWVSQDSLVPETTRLFCLQPPGSACFISWNLPPSSFFSLDLYTFRGERRVVKKSTLCTLVIMMKKMDGPLLIYITCRTFCAKAKSIHSISNILWVITFWNVGLGKQVIFRYFWSLNKGIILEYY